MRKCFYRTAARVPAFIEECHQRGAVARPVFEFTVAIAAGLFAVRREKVCPATLQVAAEMAEDYRDAVNSVCRPSKRSSSVSCLSAPSIKRRWLSIVSSVAAIQAFIVSPLILFAHKDQAATLKPVAGGTEFEAHPQPLLSLIWRHSGRRIFRIHNSGQDKLLHQVQWLKRRIVFGRTCEDGHQPLTRNDQNKLTAASSGAEGRNWLAVRFK